MTALLTDNLPLLAGAPNGIKKLRELILELAVRGKLVPQDANDGQASDWLRRIEIEKARLHESGLLKKPKKVTDVELDFGTPKVPSSWNWVALSDITLGMDSGWSPACEPNPSSNNDVWGVLKTTAVQVMQFLQQENKELPAHLDPKPDAEVKAGDILFTRAGPTSRVGISCLVESTRPRLMISDKIIRFQPIEAGTYGRYIALCLNAGSTARYLETAKSGMAASQVNISQGKLKIAPVPLAPLPEQHRIVAKVDELMALCDRLEAQQADADSAHAQLVQALLASLTQASDAADFAQSWQRLAEHFHTLFTTESSIDALKQTLLQLAVMGKLVPQDPSDEPASELLKRIAGKKALLMADGKIRRQKALAKISDDEKLFELPAEWTWARLEDISHVFSGNAFKSEDFQEDSGAKVIKITNAGVGEFIRTNDYLPAGYEYEYASFRVLKGDLILALTRPYISTGLKISRCPAEYDGALLNQRVSAIRFSCEMSNEFGFLFLKSPIVLAIYQERFGNSGLQPNLKMADVTSLVIPIPPAAEQHRIVAKVDQLMALCDQLKNRLTQARQLHEQLANTLVEQAVA
ncbi:restriction endonuclease subunit S [Pseudomonas abyssi]|uniref:restriction endonuclease subunit S n=1 Tax=Pseudomonas abyssi TaxID=170540 RepID=UPI003C7D68D8